MTVFRGVDTMWGGAPLQKCHWPVNDSFHRVDTMWGGAPLQNVIDRSMTILIEVIQKLSLTGQWQFSEGSTPCGEVHLYKLSLTGQWQLAEGSTPCGEVHLYKNVIDRSMTILKQPLKCHWLVNDKFWGSPILSWSMVKAENHCLIILIMDIRLMAKCHWPQSMTKIYGQNFKKIVIDHGQWQKKLSLTESILCTCKNS